jgi:histidine ammonia-lyase
VEECSLAAGEGQVRLDPSPAFRARIAAAEATLAAALRGGAPVYGVTTGVGASVGNEIPAEQRGDMPYHLMRFHGCGTGAILGESRRPRGDPPRSASRRGAGRTLELLERLCELLNQCCRVPEAGSVGRAAT